MEPTECDRCGSTIVLDRFKQPYGLPPKPKGDGNVFEAGEARLCSQCVYDLYEWVKGESIDRSDTVDPVSLERLNESVERHIEELEKIQEWTAND